MCFLFIIYIDYESTQKDELETLRDMGYKLKMKNNIYPNISYKIELIPYPDNDEPNHVGIILDVSYPKNYPSDDVIPIVNVERMFKKELSISKINNAKDLTKNYVNEQMGMECIFGLCEELRQFLQDNNIPTNASFHDQMKAERERDQRLAKYKGINDENKVAFEAHSIQDFDKSFKAKKGTSVTKDSFNIWLQKYQKIYNQRRSKYIKKIYGNDPKKDKLTGKEIFIKIAKDKLKINDDDNNDINNNDNNEIKEIHVDDESLFLDEMPDI